MRASVLLLGFLVTGCASNIVSLSEWWSRTTFIGPGGDLYEGKTTFHWTYRDGTIEIANSSYGSLSGRFTTQTPTATASSASLTTALSSNDAIVVPALTSTTVTLGNSKGSAYLAHDGKVVLRCSIGVDFKTLGMGDAQMVGGGSCADAEGKISQIMFGR